VIADSAFRLSRVQEGWKAARRLPLVGRKNVAANMESLNPYSTAPERSRWVKGFMSALETECGQLFRLLVCRQLAGGPLCESPQPRYRQWFCDQREKKRFVISAV
jgi:hypothetical protein